MYDLPQEFEVSSINRAKIQKKTTQIKHPIKMFLVGCFL